MVNNLINPLLGKLRSLVGRYVVSRKAHDALGLERNALQIERDTLLAELAPIRRKKERINHVYGTALELFSGFKMCKKCVDAKDKAFKEYSDNANKLEVAWRKRREERYQALPEREKKLIKYGVIPRWYKKNVVPRGTFEQWRKGHGILIGMFEGCEECKRLCTEGLDTRERTYARTDTCKCNVIGCTNNSDNCENIDPDDYNEES